MSNLEHSSSVISGAVFIRSGLWTVAGEGLIGLVFLAYGFTRNPLDFNELNPRRKPLSVKAARIVYIPLGLLFIFFAVRDILRFSLVK